VYALAAYVYLHACFLVTSSHANFADLSCVWLCAALQIAHTDRLMCACKAFGVMY
jgi:hypothetical protein